MRIFNKVMSVFIASLISTVGICFISSAQENITITTYYPSPHGSYNELEVHGSISLIRTGYDTGELRLVTEQGSIWNFHNRADSPVPGYDSNKLYLTYSPDGGVNWTNPRLIVTTVGNVQASGQFLMFRDPNSPVRQNGCLMLSYGSNSWRTTCPLGTTLNTDISPPLSSQGGIFYCCS